jgi:replicative DNA helicase
MDAYWAAWDRAVSGSERYIMTGFPSFDEFTGGIRPGELLIIGGVPSSGKTTVGMQIALNNVLGSPRVPVGIVSLEMTRNALLDRAIANVTRTNSRDLRRKREILDAERARIREQGDTTLRPAPLYIAESTDRAFPAIKTQCHLLKSRHPTLGIILVDYIQMLNTGKGSPDEKKHERLEDVSYGLKTLGLELGIVVIALAQLNAKSIAGRPDKSPEETDLQGSSGMSQAADFVWLCHRPAQYATPGGDYDPLLYINSVKGRDTGPIGFKLASEAQYMSVTDVGVGYPSPPPTPTIGSPRGALPSWPPNER